MVAEVIRLGTYQLKDDNGNVLTNTWNIEQLRRFFPKNSVLPFSFHSTFAPTTPQSERSRPGSVGGSMGVRYHPPFLLLYSNTFLPK